MSLTSALIIGRFQPFHVGHRELVEAALAIAPHVFILIGSARGPRSLRNPFTAAERHEMLAKNLAGLAPGRIHYLEVRDYFYNNEGWINEVREKLREAQSRVPGATGPTAIVGHHKDATSAYLRWFPEWRPVEIPSTHAVDATPIRQDFLRASPTVAHHPALTVETREWLATFAQGTAYRDLHDEQLAIDEYKKSWSTAPFPPVFVTTDTLLVCNEHILLIQRKRAPGRGLWANPGGFLDGDETIFECALRELKEETALEVTEAELRAAFKAVRVFDHPLRSSRGRTISHAHLFHLRRPDLPRFHAGDDAAAARWVPLLDLGKMESDLFEDHFHMIHLMLPSRL